MTLSSVSSRLSKGISKQARRVSTGTLPDIDEETRQTAVAQGKLRYSRFGKSVGPNMVGDAHAALTESMKSILE